MANTFEEVQKAVMLRYNADVALSGAANLYFNAVPKNEPYPFVVYYLEGDFARNFGGKTENITLQFNAYSKAESSLECSDILADLLAEFDSTRLSVTNHNTTHLRATNRQLFQESSDQHRYWQGVLILNFNITDLT